MDVERTFEVLQARFALVREPAKPWDSETLWETMTTCVIIDTMIVEDVSEGVRHGLKFQEMRDPI